MLKEYFDSISSNQLTIIVLTLSMVVGGTAALTVYEINPGQQEAEFVIQGWIEDPEGEDIRYGFDTGGEGMSYGEMVLGTNLTRSLDINTSQTTYVQARAEGNMSKGLEFERKHFSDEDFQIPFEYITERQNQTGYVDGNIYVNIRTADNRWEEKWLRTLYLLP